MLELSLQKKIPCYRDIDVTTWPAAKLQKTKENWDNYSSSSQVVMTNIYINLKIFYKALHLQSEERNRCLKLISGIIRLLVMYLRRTVLLRMCS